MPGDVPEAKESPRLACCFSSWYLVSLFMQSMKKRPEMTQRPRCTFMMVLTFWLVLRNLMTLLFQPLGVGRFMNMNRTTSTNSTRKNPEQMSSNILKYLLRNPTSQQLRKQHQTQRYHHRQLYRFMIMICGVGLRFGVWWFADYKMDELTPEQYETVLKYMETVNEDSFEAAAQTLSHHNYSLQRAVDSRFGHNPPPRQQNPVDDQEIVRRYMEHVQRRNAEWSPLGAVFDFFKILILGILSLVLRIFPATLVTRYFGSDFEKLYQGQVAYRHRKLKAQLRQTKNLSSRSVLLVISPRQRHGELVALLRAGAVRQKMEKDFFLSCYVAGNSELQGIQGAGKAPQIMALRMNIFEEVVVMGRTEDPKSVNEEQLVKWAHDGRNLFRRDGNVLVKYRNFVARFYGHNYEEEEEEEVNLVQRQQESQEIRQQNEAYQRIEQQARVNSQLMEEKRRKEEEEARQMEELLQERQIRKMSIPDEPTEGQIVRISFRCPDGSTIIRNFAADEKLELIYHWVEVNEEIEFEDPRRQFEIMYSYPPEPLSARKDQLLSRVFDSPQEKVVIREL